MASLVPESELVDDVVQETFVAVTARADAYDVKQSFSAWLFTVARDKIRELSGKATAEARPLADEVLDVLIASRGDAKPSSERLQLVEDCIAALAPQARRIVELRYQNAMKPRQVAAAIGWTAASVRVASLALPWFRPPGILAPEVASFKGGRSAAASCRSGC